MKKDSLKEKDTLRDEYKQSDFPGGLVRGKYTKRISSASNIIVLKPEVANFFPNEEAVNDALLSLIEIAYKIKHKTKKPRKHSH
jgi:hypothetical protein